MANQTLTLNTDTIHYQVRGTVTELCSSAEKIRLVASALEDTAGELPASAHGEELRRAAAVVRTHAFGMLMSAARIATKAERLEAMADVRAAADPPADDESDDSDEQDDSDAQDDNDGQDDNDESDGHGE